MKSAKSNEELGSLVELLFFGLDLVCCQNSGVLRTIYLTASSGTTP
jgi:hypothetical protein